MSVGAIFFAVCSVICVIGALSVVLARNPIRGAVGLLATIVGIAGLFLRLDAQFLAAIQLIVYAGAVVVLFVFVVMLLGPSAGFTSKAEARSKVSRIFAGGLMALLGALMLVLLAPKNPQKFGAAAEGHGSIEAVGGLIFTEGLPVFELVTALLIVAVIGAIAVARTQPGQRKPARVENPTLRLFHGPLLPRDAERPLSKAPAAQADPGGGMIPPTSLGKEQA